MRRDLNPVAGGRRFSDGFGASELLVAKTARFARAVPLEVDAGFSGDVSVAVDSNTSRSGSRFRARRRTLPARRALVDALILLAIAFYQRHLSPRKGYRCAHSVLHGGHGCSGAIFLAVEERGWRRAVPLARARFRECHLAARILRAQSGRDSSGDSDSNSAPAKRKGSAAACDWCVYDPCFWFNFIDCCPGEVLCADAMPCACSSCV